MYMYLQKLELSHMGEAYHVIVKKTIMDSVWHVTYWLPFFPTAMETAAWELQGKTKDSQCIALQTLKNTLQLSSLISCCMVITTQISLFAVSNYLSALLRN